MKVVIRKFKSLIGRMLSLLSRPIKASVWYQTKFVDFNHRIYPDNVWYREHDERNFEVVNLGSSGGKWAFDWAAAGVKGMNWAQQPQTLIDDFRLLKNFHSILKKNGTVIITLMPFSGLNKKMGVMDAFKYLGTLYLDVMQDMPYLAVAQRLKSYPILFGKSAIKAGIRHLLGREVHQVDARLTMERNPMSAAELERDAENRMNDWSQQFGIADFEAPLTGANRRGREIRVRILREMIDFCFERGYSPVYVIPPVTKYLAVKFTPRFREVYIDSFIREVGRDVRLLNYLNDDGFLDPDFYCNSFLLNACGRRIFTECVCAALGLKGNG